MSRFIVLYQAPLGVAERFAQATPAEAAAGMQLWVDWGERTGDALVDPGGPLANARKVTSDGTAPTDTRVIGMSILEAESMEAALAMVGGHHHLQWAKECEIVVLEEMGIPELET